MKTFQKKELCPKSYNIFLALAGYCCPVSKTSIICHALEAAALGKSQRIFLVRNQEIW